MQRTLKAGRTLKKSRALKQTVKIKPRSLQERRRQMMEVRRTRTA